MSMKKPQLGMSARKTVGNTVYHIFMVALSVIMIYPFIWSLLSSFKSSEQLYGGNPLDLWPRPFTMENYKRLFQVLPFDKFMVNSVFLSVAMPFCMIAVALSRHMRSRGWSSAAGTFCFLRSSPR